MNDDNLNYILSQDQTYDVVNLRPLIPGDQYYVSGGEEITSAVVSTFLTETYQQLNDMLSGIISSNISANLDSLVYDVIKDELNKKFHDLRLSAGFVTYKGESETLKHPYEVEPGSIYKVNDEFYLYDNNCNAVRLITSGEIDGYLSSQFYTRDETDNIFANVSSQIKFLEDKFMPGLSSFNNFMDKYVTSGEYEETKYEVVEAKNKITSIEGQLSTICEATDSLLNTLNSFDSSDIQTTINSLESILSSLNRI